MIQHIDHVAITVKDMARAIDFYTKKLGFTITQTSETSTVNVVFVGIGQVQLELFALKQGAAKPMPELLPDEVGMKHIAFHVFDIDAEVTALREKGIEFIGEIRQAGRRRLIFFKDPDGTTLQLIQG